MLAPSSVNISQERFDICRELGLTHKQQLFAIFRLSTVCSEQWDSLARLYVYAHCAPLESITDFRQRMLKGKVSRDEYFTQDVYYKICTFCDGFQLLPMAIKLSF